MSLHQSGRGFNGRATVNVLVDLWKGMVYIPNHPWNKIAESGRVKTLSPAVFAKARYTDSVAIRALLLL